SAGGATLLNADANIDSNPLTLLAGSYYLVLAGEQAGSSPYAFQLLNAGAAPQLPPDGGPVTGTLNPGTPTTFFPRSGNAGDLLYSHPLNSPGSGNWFLYGPANQPLANKALANDLTATLPATGSYLLALFGGAASGTISYDFSAHLVSTVTNPVPTAPTA